MCEKKERGSAFVVVVINIMEYGGKQTHYINVD